jgi:hypothetical protein
MRVLQVYHLACSMSKKLPQNLACTHTHTHTDTDTQTDRQTQTQTQTHTRTHTYHDHQTKPFMCWFWRTDQIPPHTLSLTLFLSRSFSHTHTFWLSDTQRGAQDRRGQLREHGANDNAAATTIRRQTRTAPPTAASESAVTSFSLAAYTCQHGRSLVQ